MKNVKLLIQDSSQSSDIDSLIADDHIIKTKNAQNKQTNNKIQHYGYNKITNKIQQSQHEYQQVCEQEELSQAMISQLINMKNKAKNQNQNRKQVKNLHNQPVQINKQQSIIISETISLAPNNIQKFQQLINNENNQLHSNQNYFDEKVYQLMQQSKNQSIKRLKTESIQKQQYKQTFQQNQNKLKGRIVQPSIAQNQNKLLLNQINVYFPYQPYDLQKQYMYRVIKALNQGSNALLQSPTGTGKTLCLLCSVLSWADAYNYNQHIPMSLLLDKTNKNERNNKVTVIYCSRTHTQLRQVQAQLDKTCFRPTMANFGSRDQFCIKSEFSKLNGRDLMQSCSKAVKLYLRARRKLQLQKQQEQIQMKPTDQGQQPVQAGKKQKQKSFMCSYYKSQNEYTQILQSRYLNRIITSQMIKQQGKTYHFCPYYYAFQIKQKADLIFMPYNYILDVTKMPRYQSIIKNSIIIFDQAHNVPQAACQGRSFSIFSSSFPNIQAQISKLQYHPHMSSQLKQVVYVYEKTIELVKKQIFRFCKQLDNFVDHVYKQKTGQEQRLKYYDIDNIQQQQFDIQQIYKPDQLCYYINNWFNTGQFFNKQDFQSFDKDVKRQIYTRTVNKLRILTKQISQLIQALKQTYDGIFQNLQKINTFIQKCLNLIQQFSEDRMRTWHQIQINHYRLWIKCSAKIGQLNYQVRLVCLTPSLTFSQLLSYKPRSIIMTSGTLSPLDSWQKQLKIPFKVQLVNKHVIQNDQLHLGIVCNSIGNQSLFNFSYNQLQNNKNIYQKLLQSIVQFAKTIPNGILAIFPSYRIFKNFKDQMIKNIYATNEIKKYKFLCYEEKGTIDYTIANFKNKAKTKKGAILFCVCRGKVSQGLDFSDELCRGVIFVGVPYPNIMDPILKQKRDYYDKLASQYKRLSRNSSNQIKSLNGDEWYTLNTMRAVNQGIGRVIRHIQDYGVILMLDSRYDTNKLKSMLPMWAKLNMKTYSVFQQINQKLNSFFENMLHKFGRNKQLSQCQSGQFSQPVAEPKKSLKQRVQILQNKYANKPKNAFDFMMGNRKNVKKKPVDKKQKPGFKEKEYDF